MASKILSRNVLAEFTTLPKLVHGSVAILYPESNAYRLVRVAKWVTIEDNFNPVNYVLVVCDIWGMYIADAKTKESEEYLVNAQLRDLQKVRKPIKVGDKIHLDARRGIYTVLALGSELITVTCKSWHGDVRQFHVSQYKCHAGGFWN